MSSLLERQKPSNQSFSKGSSRLSRLRSLSFRRRPSSKSSPSPPYSELNIDKGPALNVTANDQTNVMPTILEMSNNAPFSSSSLDRRNVSTGVRQIINSIKNAPNRLSQSIIENTHRHGEENSNLTKNILD